MEVLPATFTRYNLVGMVSSGVLRWLDVWMGKWRL